jgi:hypothetical protein
MNSQHARTATNGSSSDQSRQISQGGDRNGDVRSSMTRAEKFEDEKRRIVESCFAKRDADGACKQSPFLLRVYRVHSLTMRKQMRSHILRIFASSKMLNIPALHHHRILLQITRSRVLLLLPSRDLAGYECIKHERIVT